MTDLNPGVSLAGNWKYALDRDDSGVERGWPKGIPGEETLTWPGSLATNGIGDDVTVDTPFTGRILDRSYFTEARYAKYRQLGNIKFPCFLTPLKFYKGVAWYEKDFEVPVEWAGRQLHLELERVHFASDVWVNGVHAGRSDSLGTPHRAVLGSMRPGLHTLVIRTDNRLVVDVGLHYKGMSREDAIKYMMAHERISEQEATAEIERYMAIPGQALSYKIGQLTITGLRNKYEQELGSKFDIAAFHDEVLRDGVVPLNILKEKMTDWAKKYK